MNIDNQKIHEYFYNEEEEEYIQKVSVGGPGGAGLFFNIPLFFFFLFIAYKIYKKFGLTSKVSIFYVLPMFTIVGTFLSGFIIGNKNKNNIAEISFTAGIFTGINICIAFIYAFILYIMNGGQDRLMKIYNYFNQQSNNN